MLFGGGGGLARSAASRRAAAVLGAVLALVALALALGTSGIAAGGTLAVDGTQRSAHVESYGPSGATVLGYEEGATVTLRTSVANRGFLPVTISEVDALPERLALLTAVRVAVDGQPLPVRVAPRTAATVEILARFDHCEYYTERALNRFDHARITWRTAGLQRTTDVAYPDELLVRSPTIVGCPDRVLDRSAKQRSEDATITGRG